MCLKMEKVGEMTGGFITDQNFVIHLQGRVGRGVMVAGKLHNLIAHRSILLSLNDGQRNQRKGPVGSG